MDGQRASSRFPGRDFRRLRFIQRRQKAALQRCGHRINSPGNAAEILGLNPSMLRSRLKKLGIRRA